MTEEKSGKVVRLRNRKRGSKQESPGLDEQTAAPVEGGTEGGVVYGVVGHGLVSLADIVAHPEWNSRKTVNDKADKELCESIAASGLLQSLVVKNTTPAATEGEPEPKPSYFLVSGFRRYRALVDLEWTRPVPVTFVEGEMADLRAMNVEENEKRRDLKAWELAEACYDLTKAPYGWKTEKIAARLGKSPKHVANMIRVRTKLHPELWEQMKTAEAGEKVSLKHWIKLAAIPVDEQMASYDQVVKGVGKVDAAERKIDRVFEQKAAGEAEEGSGEASGGGKGSDKDKGKKPNELAMIRMRTLVAHSRKPKDWKTGAQAILTWLLGEGDPPIADASFGAR